MRIALIFLVACGGNGGGGGGDDGPGPDAANAPAHAGFVSIQSYDAMNIPGTPTRGGSTSAGFFTAGSACTTMQTIGPCKVQQCATTQPQGAQSAGTITITGATKPLSLVPGTDKLYAQQMSMTSLFNGGDMITFAAAGADVPAFSVTLTTPTKATITAPAKPAAGSLLAINRAQDFSVSWTGGGSGRVQVFLSGTGGSTSLFCKFDASAGTGKVPAAALATMTGTTGSFAMASIAETDKTSGDWGIGASAYFNAVWPDAAIVSGGTMIQ